jgi:hypothetical protein
VAASFREEGGEEEAGIHSIGHKQLFVRMGRAERAHALHLVMIVERICGDLVWGDMGVKGRANNILDSQVVFLVIKLVNRI